MKGDRELATDRLKAKSDSNEIRFQQVLSTIVLFKLLGYDYL